MMTITFSDGKTETVPLDMAVWIPEPVYERLTLELKMPRDVREGLQTQEEYPSENLTGYPTSGAVASPAVYPRAATVVLDSDPVFINSVYPCLPYVPLYPRPVTTQYSKPSKVVKSVVKSEDVNAIIPGTNITQRELDEKVTSQLNEHKLLFDERENEKVQPGKKLLKKRDKQLENSLKKSVSFKDIELLKQELGYNAKEMEDIYIQDMDSEDRDVSSPVSDDDEFKVGAKAEMTSMGVNTDSSLLFHRSRGLGRRPPWRYWSQDPSPAKADVKSHHGPFRETAMQAPLEARDQRMLNGSGKNFNIVVLRVAQWCMCSTDVQSVTSVGHQRFPDIRIFLVTVNALSNK